MATRLPLRHPAIASPALPLSTPASPTGIVATTTLFGQLAIELQMSEDINPMARVPGLDVEPCAVTPLPN